MVSLLWLATFVLGGIPFGFLAGKLNGIDVRNEGSGNIGATNVFRTVGKGWGIAVFLLDFLKAFIPLLVYRWMLNRTDMPMDLHAFLIVAGVLAVLGHNYSPFLGFKGGKGMATSAGFLFALLPVALGVCLLGWMIVFATTRYVSLASIVSGLLLPPTVFVLYPGEHWLLGAAVALALLSVWRHRTNIRRLKEGTEHRFSRKQPNLHSGEPGS